MTLKSEIFEQPAILNHLVVDQMKHVQGIARELSGHDFHYVFLAARGTSDNAGVYTEYLWGAFNRIPVMLATPSLFSIYKRPPLLNGALVMGISQSGQSPDIVSVLEEGKRQGRPTLAITNDSASPLAKTADFVIDIQAGQETAVAATKTYTAQLMAIAMLSTALQSNANKRKALLEALKAIPEWMELTLMLDDQIERVAQRYRYMQQCVVLGRGYNYATAFEWSLKLKELTYVAAEPYSPADFQHGPIAILERGFPVLAVVPSGAVFEDIMNLLSYLQHEQKVELLAISDDARALDLADVPIMLPTGIPEWLTPLVSILPAQLFTYHLTLAKGYDTEAPRGLKKVTKTQ
jgi:glucosamine--fructose-6-phosphate aminotransferase (isomerizing)